MSEIVSKYKRIQFNKWVQHYYIYLNKMYCILCDHLIEHGKNIPSPFQFNYCIYMETIKYYNPKVNQYCGYLMSRDILI